MSESQERMQYLVGALGSPFFEGNRVRPLDNGDEIFPAMLEAIRNSQESIELLTFIYWTGDVAQAFADALSERAQANVKTRVILDAFGSADISKQLVEQMEQAGVQIHWFRPAHRSWKRFDWRTHRKVLVCDGRIGFTGGVGIAKEWEGDARNPDEWRETHFQIEGPAVAGLNGAFWDNWVEENRETAERAVAHYMAPLADGIPLQVTQSSSTHRVTGAYKMLQAIIALANSQLDISCPYFVPPMPLLNMICERAKSGAKVRLLIPGEYTDKRFERLEATRYFSQLLDAGVRIFLYQKTMIHTKLILCDDDLALFGSINFNRRSMRKDEEIGVIAADPQLTTQLRQIFETDIKDAKELHAKSWSGPSLFETLTHSILSPFRSQM